MQILTDGTVVVGWTVSKIRPPQHAATFLVKGTYKLVRGKPASQEGVELEFLTGDTHRDEDPEKILCYASDFSPQKPRADVILLGTAYAPGGRSVPILNVRLSVGSFSKELRVTGPRVWKRNLLSASNVSDPEPFVSLPLSYEHAFGGPGYAKNPMGRGRSSDLLPQIEDPGHPTKGPHDNNDPAGFGPIPCTWPQRKALLGTYNARWRKERWPWFAEDMDPGYFCAAPRDQQIAGFLRGDEQVVMENLHREHPIYQAQLPCLRARCFVVDVVREKGERFREVALKLDTLWIDMDRLKLVLVWRGDVEVQSLKAKELARVYACTEPLSATPGSAEHHRKRLDDQMIEPEDGTAKAHEAEFAAALAAHDEANAQMEKEFAETDKEMELLEQQAARDEAALLKDQGGMVAPETFQKAASTPVPQAATVLLAGLANVQQANPAQAPVLGDPGAILAEQQAADKAAQDIESDGFDEEFRQAFPEEEPLTREAVQQAAASGESLAGRELEELDLSELDLTRANLGTARLAKVNLTRTKLVGANLAGADLRKANLTGADLTGANLDDADLEGAILAGAKVTDLSLADTLLAGLDLQGLDFSRSKGIAVDFSTAKLQGAKFVGAFFPKGNFAKSSLAKASFQEAKLPAAQFEQILGPEINMDGADLSGIHASEGCDFRGGSFKRISGKGAIFEQALLDKANFSGSMLDGAQFGDASLLQTVFDRCSLVSAGFDDACLQKAELTNANLLRASFDRADLSDASLRGSNLYEAGFWEARLERTTLLTANLKGTLLG